MEDSILQNKKIVDRRWSSIRKQILERDEYNCQCCGENKKLLEVHHKIPRQKGGTDEPENLVTLCRSCHKTQEWDDDLFWNVPKHETPFLKYGDYLADLFERLNSPCSRCGELQSDCLGSCDCVQCVWQEKLLKEEEQRYGDRSLW